MRKDTLVREVGDLGRAILFPVVDVFGSADTEGTAGVDEGADGVVVFGGDDGLFVGFRGAGFGGSDESG